MSRFSAGGLIDRALPLKSTFDGKPLAGFQGDTLASALVASGIRLVGRSFKYHRPRGILTAGPEEPNALVEMRHGARREPNTRVTTTELYDGLAADSQNRWPSLRFDLLSVNQLVSPLLVAGFYYKTFMWPASFWEKLYEPLIRRAAGLGRGAGVDDPDTYEKANAFCDVLVVGSGPAGLMAALAAGRAGARVIVCEEDFAFGGRLLGETHEVAAMPGPQWVAGIVAELASLPNVTLMPRTSVTGIYDGGTYAALQRVSDHLPEPPPFQPRQRLWKIVARRAVLASGAIERGIVFGGNDVPGVMMAGAVRTYVNRFAVAPMQRLAIFTNNDSGWRILADVPGGMKVAAIVDTRAELAPSLLALARKAGAEVFAGGQVNDAHGGREIEALDIRAGDGRHVRLAVDGLAMSGGWNLNIGLASHLGHRPVWRAELAAFAAEALPGGLTVAGAAAGGLSLGTCLAQGAAAGARAGEDTGFKTRTLQIPASSEDPASITAFWHVGASRKKAFVDFQHDVTDKDIEIAHREGFRSVEHLKRYTTLGMATDQGKLANIPGLAMMAALTGRSIEDTGTTVLRPPHHPVALGAFAGHSTGKHFRPVRLSPLHEWSKSLNASFAEIGAWLRPEFYPLPGENDWLTACTREVNAVRSQVGLCDVSTLGKIDVMGPDAGAFLDLIYANTFSTLAVGKVRYGLMLREDGLVMDDGTCARLAPDHYVMSTTTANAVKVMQHLEFCHQVTWPGLDVQLASVSEQWAQMALAGPRARDVLQAVLDPGCDVSDAALPYMGHARASVGGVPVRLFRISFSGELAYEIAVAASLGAALAAALMQAGAPFGIVPYGLEALNVLRIEKGHATGSEITGQTTAADLGLGKMLSTKKDFIGRLLAQRPGLTDPLRPALAGFRPVDRTDRLRSGAHFVARNAAPIAAHDEGYMTSCCYSPSIGSWIGLGLIRGGVLRAGEIVRAVDLIRQSEILVEICSPHFVDPVGERLRPEALIADQTADAAADRVKPAAPSAVGDRVGLLRRAVGDRACNVGRSGPPGVVAHWQHYGAAALVLARKGQTPALAAKIANLHGLAVPDGPGRVAAGEIAFTGLAPGQWLATGPEGFVARLENGLAGLASVSDQTDARVFLRLKGATLRETLAKGVPLDLHPASFAPGAAAATLVAHVSVWLWRLEHETFELAVPRSMLGSFMDWFNASAAEFGLEVAGQGCLVR